MLRRQGRPPEQATAALEEIGALATLGTAAWTGQVELAVSIDGEQPERERRGRAGAVSWYGSCKLSAPRADAPPAGRASKCHSETGSLPIVFSCIITSFRLRDAEVSSRPSVLCRTTKAYDLTRDGIVNCGTNRGGGEVRRNRGAFLPITTLQTPRAVILRSWSWRSAEIPLDHAQPEGRGDRFHRDRHQLLNKLPVLLGDRLESVDGTGPLRPRLLWFA